MDAFHFVDPALRDDSRVQHASLHRIERRVAIGRIDDRAIRSFSAALGDRLRFTMKFGVSVWPFTVSRSSVPSKFPRADRVPEMPLKMPRSALSNVNCPSRGVVPGSHQCHGRSGRRRRFAGRYRVGEERLERHLARQTDLPQSSAVACARPERACPIPVAGWSGWCRAHRVPR